MALPLGELSAKQTERAGGGQNPRRKTKFSHSKDIPPILGHSFLNINIGKIIKFPPKLLTSRLSHVTLFRLAGVVQW